MARKTFVEMIDDLSGEVATETVVFALDGVDYEIDLTEDNATKLRSELGAYAEKSRRVGGRAKRGAGKPAASNDAAKVREWARENGYDVPERGRIPGEIRDAYESGTPKADAGSKADEKPAKNDEKASEDKPKVKEMIFSDKDDSKK